MEVAYFLFLSEKKFFTISADTKKHLIAVVDKFRLDDALEIKKIEKTTNHDVKAVEYFLKTRLEQTKDEETKEWIHFGLTSRTLTIPRFPALETRNGNRISPFILNLKKQRRPG